MEKEGSWKDVFPEENRYYEVENGILYLGDSLEVLCRFPDNTIDAVVTDPPYGLKFMNQKWDYDVPNVEMWKKNLRVMKPGGHLLSFFGTRTYHRGVVNIEDAGFEIRDMIQWLYGSGFPKSMDISKAIDKEFGKLDEREVLGFKNTNGLIRRLREKGIQQGYDKDWYGVKDIVEITAPATPEAAKWQGWGTALKPAVEPIVLARKPVSEKNIARNVLKWGTGGLNIDGTRIPTNEEIVIHSTQIGKFQPDLPRESYKDYRTNNKGRFPANVILDEEAAKMLDEQAPKVGGGHWAKGKISGYGKYYGGKTEYVGKGDKDGRGGASRFFYTAKAGRKERYFYCRDCDDVFPMEEYEEHKEHDVVFHPTVKPEKLIEYLVKLITPPEGIVLDLFFGTGTLGVVCERMGYKWIGIEINEEYCRIAKRRIEVVKSKQKLF